MPHCRSGDRQDQETLLPPSADNQTRNYDTECSDHHRSLSPVDTIVRLPHPRNGDSQGEETFLAPSADNHTRNYDIYQ